MALGTDTVVWRDPSEWRYSEQGQPAGWGAVVGFEWSRGCCEQPAPAFGRVDFCPFCGARLEAPNATSGGAA